MCRYRNRTHHFHCTIPNQFSIENHASGRHLLHHEFSEIILRIHRTSSQDHQNSKQSDPLKHVVSLIYYRVATFNKPRSIDVPMGGRNTLISPRVINCYWSVLVVSILIMGDLLPLGSFLLYVQTAIVAEWPHLQTISLCIVCTPKLNSLTNSKSLCHTG